jgi:hypothetical protein
MDRTPGDRRRPPAKPRVNGPTPPFRRLRVYAFDPSLDTQLEMAVINQLVVKVRWEDELKRGPIGEYLEVIDYDPASAAFYPPVCDSQHLLDL